MNEQQPPSARLPGAGPSAGPDRPEEPTAVHVALSRLDGLAQRPVGEHVAVFDEVHRLLQDALAALDAA